MEAGRTKTIGRSQILDRLKDIVEPWVSDLEAVENLNEQTNLLAELAMDSVAILQLILETEKQFGISINDQQLDAGTFSKMGNLVNIIQNKIYENN